MSENRRRARLALDPADGAGLSWLYRHTEVMDEDDRDDGQLAVTVRADPAKAELVAPNLDAPYIALTRRG